VAYGTGFGLMITGFAVALRVGGPMNAGNDLPGSAAPGIRGQEEGPLP
jgi:hypothetical protein